MVEQRIVLDRRIDSERHRNHHGDAQTAEREFKRRRQALADQFCHRFVEFERFAKVAGDSVREEIPILHDQRLIQAPLVARALDIARRRVIAQQ